jgi:hypothetical protein
MELRSSHDSTAPTRQARFRRLRGSRRPIAVCLLHLGGCADLGHHRGGRVSDDAFAARGILTRRGRRGNGQCAAPRQSLLQGRLEGGGHCLYGCRWSYCRFPRLRKCCSTLLTMQGVHPRIVQQILQHSTIDLTMNTYTDATLLPLGDAVAKIPDLWASSLASKRRKLVPIDGKGQCAFLRRFFLTIPP